MKKSLLCLSLLSLMNPQAFGSTTKSLSRGEICEISTDMNVGGGEEYTKGDRKSVIKLCSYDVHSQPSENLKGQKQAVAVCPKLNSTFPAVEFIEISKKSTRAEVEAQCNRKVGSKNGDKIAKFKYSMSCANTSSIIGYYHVSRALGIKMVPPVVLRSMDRKFHMGVADTAKSYVGGDKQLISQNWRRLHSMLANKDSDITSPDGNFTVGALAVNPTGEQKTYDGIYLGGNGQGERLANFMGSSSSTYRKLKIRKPVSHIVGAEFTSSNYTAIQQMKDVSDMIVLDTIFGQKDRFANTHSIYTWLVVDSDGELEKVDLDDIKDMIKEDVESGVPGMESLFATFTKAKDLPKDWRKDVNRRKAKLQEIVADYLNRKGLKHAFAENLLLKDNDCGLKDSNPFLSSDVIAGVYHVSPETFDQLMKLYQKVIVEGSMDSFLSDNLDMNANDIAKFKKGLKHVAEDLKAKDDRGDLYKDLEVKAHLVPKPREKTADGYPIYEITNDGFNVRKSLVIGKEPQSLDETEVIQYQGADLQTARFSKVALIERLQIGKYAFVKVRVIESQAHNGQVVYFAIKAVQ